MTPDDEVMNLLLETITAGWPETKVEVPNFLPYFNSRSEFSVQDCLSLKGKSVVIASTMSDEVRKRQYIPRTQE